jgi:hypothetical protein
VASTLAAEIGGHLNPALVEQRRQDLVEFGVGERGHSRCVLDGAVADQMAVGPALPGDLFHLDGVAMTKVWRCVNSDNESERVPMAQKNAGRTSLPALAFWSLISLLGGGSPCD